MLFWCYLKLFKLPIKPFKNVDKLRINKIRKWFLKLILYYKYLYINI